MLGRLWCVDSIALPTSISLAPRWMKACFVLFPIRSAFWTLHVSHSILFLILGTPLNLISVPLLDKGGIIAL
jgi:hypothetical protein